MMDQMLRQMPPRRVERVIANDGEPAMRFEWVRIGTGIVLVIMGILLVLR